MTHLIQNINYHHASTRRACAHCSYYYNYFKIHVETDNTIRTAKYMYI